MIKYLISELCQLTSFSVFLLLEKKTMIVLYSHCLPTLLFPQAILFFNFFVYDHLSRLHNLEDSRIGTQEESKICFYSPIEVTGDSGSPGGRVGELAPGGAKGNSLHKN